ncbi:transposase (plasmid) [Klebsiella pneumoniae subsp. pneumoniae]|uniref:Uncharacterized protein n=1 Tax=Klebsiella pneumoniae TaxID=573 RepID=A0A2U8T1H6_KLEPN|nr:transposase mutator type [Klebsiella pneumoniae KCTC 2242]ARV43229.1 transposase [Klebsiella pneumoniae subsp. pneumoniae]ASF89417.1 transposase mutator type [Klebsiella pneumoniae]CCN32678.1 transposase mutator type [Klebsiella pneumoniae subsp. pneumoniae Ecl8]BAH66071.1 putative transposase fragment [Klebsiella pneumoniae subsp. pneumoniae NTUH-K2044]
MRKVIWLTIKAAPKKWTIPQRDWGMAMSRFNIEFGDRLSDHL